MLLWAQTDMRRHDTSLSTAAVRETLQCTKRPLLHVKLMFGDMHESCALQFTSFIMSVKFSGLVANMMGDATTVLRVVAVKFGDEKHSRKQRRKKLTLQ